MNITTAILAAILLACAYKDGRLREWWNEQSDRARVLYGTAGISLATIVALRLAGFLNY